MPETTLPPAIAVVGPTATGKSLLAQEIAVALGGEIVTADSMQVYRGMDIGTAKMPPVQRRVAHHCIDLVDPGTPFSAALYQTESRRVIDELRVRGTAPIVTGGTGLYVRSALDEMEFPTGDLETETRMRLEAEAAEGGSDALHARLAEADPESAELIHPNNVRRTIRALEMLGQGESYATQAAGFNDRVAHYPATQIGLEMDREALYARIDERVDEMLEAGLLSEIERLLADGWRDALTAAQAIGYKEFVPVVEKGEDVAPAADAVKQATRRYAKRQFTWFRRDPRIMWIDATDMTREQLLGQALELIESSAPGTSGE